jgi:hypothetical protein
MKLRYPALLLTCMSVAACSEDTSFSGKTSNPPPAGGGGGGGGGALVITSTNAPVAMSVALTAAFESGAVGDIIGTLGLGTANVGNMNKVSGGQFFSGTLANAMQQAPFGPFDQPCLVSGMITLSGDLADPLGISFAAGDTLTVVATDCDDGLGEVTNGTIDYLFTTVTGDILLGPPYRLVIDVDLTNFQVADSADTKTSNGSATVSIDTTTDPIWSVSINGPLLTTDTTTSSETISDFDMTQTVDTLVVPTPYTMVSNGTVDSTDLNGTVGYSTPVMFEGSGEAYPFTGQFLVSGENSSVLLTALDEINVRLESDFDGDGVADETTDTTWDALIAQANP